MAKLIYMMLASLDGYISDAEGNFDWAMPSDEVHAFINDLERPVGTYLYGRRMYENMTAWETMHTEPNLPPIALDFATIWQAAEKIVYSTTLEAVSTTRTRIERSFDPATIRQLKADAQRDIAVGGPDLAAHAFRAGLVDECQLFLAPVIIGAGTRALPDGVHLPLVLLDERRFANGMVFVHYRCA